MAKLHHKLKNITDYINADLRLAHSQTNDQNRAVDLATATIGVALNDMDKAVKMRKIVAASEDSYQNQEHPYNVEVAVFVSRHKIMNDSDYAELHSAIKNLKIDQQSAKDKLPLPKPHKFLGIF